MKNMLLIDEMKANLPITAYASRDLSKTLIANGFDVTPEKEVNYRVLKGAACDYAKSRVASGGLTKPP